MGIAPSLGSVRPINSNDIRALYITMLYDACSVQEKQINL